MYKVGTKVLSFADDSRAEKLGPKKGPRYVGVRLYYPAEVTNEALVKIEGKTVGEMYDNPPIVSGKYPVVVYNHGYGAYLESNNFLCCTLASQGYFVVAIGHAYECDEIKLSDGQSVFLDTQIRKLQVFPRFMGTIEALKVKGTKGDYKEQAQAFDAYQSKYCAFLNERLVEWAEDTLFAMKKVEENYPEYMAQDKGYAITGHSFGGCLAYYMCQNYDQYVCGCDIDGAIFGHYEKEMTKPFLLIINKGNVAVTSKVMIDSKAPVLREIIEDTAHLSFVDLKYYKNSNFMMGKASYEEVSTKVNELHLSFLRDFLK